MAFVSRYHEEGCIWTNILSFPYSAWKHAVIWLFPPRKLQSRLLMSLNRLKKRPAILFLLMHHAEVPAEYHLLKRLSLKTVRYAGDGIFLRPFKNKSSFKPYTGPGASIFLIPPLW